MGHCGSKQVSKRKLGEIPAPKKSILVATNSKDFVPAFVSKNLQHIESVYIIDNNVLGEGAFGEVRVAVHKQTKERRAVKMLNKNNAD